MWKHKHLEWDERLVTRDRFDGSPHTNLTFGTQFAHQFVHFRVTNKTIGPTHIIDCELLFFSPVPAINHRLKERERERLDCAIIIRNIHSQSDKIFRISAKTNMGILNGSHVCEYFTWWCLQIWGERIRFTVHCHFISSLPVQSNLFYPSWVPFECNQIQILFRSLEIEKGGEGDCFLELAKDH